MSKLKAALRFVAYPFVRWAAAVRATRLEQLDRRLAGRCIDCGDPSDGHERCRECAGNWMAAP